MMSSDKEEFTEDEFEEQEGVKDFNYFSIFKIPLMLFILSFTSVVFVEIFGRSYLRSRWISGQELKVYIDSNFNQTRAALSSLESGLSGSIFESRSALKELSTQVDEIERRVSLRTDYLEKMISESRVGSF
ncbi:hypothetical protein OJ252_2906 [Cryptosporidium canis]|uniref:Uncharacterized protein n=1 Tax=Cryptosporidium canis TaxID=195482 RepID=A0ABQ8P3W0_9CRYT|nr:hypothetical protein OJ252_2906 [Cryptosporidium canis]